METAQVANFPVVGDAGGLGAEVTRRRERLRATIGELAEVAGVSRDTLSDLEAGNKQTRHANVRKVLDALESLEQEAFGRKGEEQPPPAQASVAEQITFTVSGDFGVTVTVMGPIADRAELEESVANIIRSIRASKDDPAT